MPENKRILIVGPSWVGDMVMAQNLFQLLKAEAKREKYGLEITVLAPGWSEPVLARMPQVSEVVTMPVGHRKLKLGTRYGLAKQLRKSDYHQAIVLPGSLKSALIPWFARIPLRTGFVGEQRWGLLNDIRKLVPEDLPLNVQRYLYLGLPAGRLSGDIFYQDNIKSPPKPFLVVDHGQVQTTLTKFSLIADKPVLALCPGAEYGPAKQWPAAHFAEVARAKIAEGWQVWLFGSNKDQPIAQEINQLSGNDCHDFSGKTTLGEAIDLMSMAKWVVTNDSGLMHVAAAVGCQAVAIYGSSSDEFTPPLTENCHRLSLDLDCRPCFKRTCPFGHTDCLNHLFPDRVLPLIR
ncbi:MAG: lipopolysaccharide heptosyltransferase II [Gammaproteobacteria bacterium]|nr:lipopolysaccharide heptosyltransferase II [Gammaproteobacteria bacterium]